MRFLALFGLIALAEMATFFWVEARIGLGWALGLALATAVIGSILVKRAGISVFARIQQRIGQSQVPGRELSDGAAILVAGAFLISPGFITDAIGFLLLVPMVRDRIYRVVSKRLTSRFTVFTATGHTFRSRRADLPPAGGEIIDIDPEDIE
ncbi:MAG: FxsA family protein [Acidimicrobiia bacterium]